jgi:hypothetical protein
VTNTKVKPIKAKLGMARAVAGNILQRANAVLAGIFTATSEYPNPPVDMATFKSSVDTLSSDITAALDGGQKAIAQRNHQLQVVNKLLQQLAHYAEANCKDDMTTFLKSGFEAVSTTKSPFSAVVAVHPQDRPRYKQWSIAGDDCRCSGRIQLRITLGTARNRRHAGSVDESTP